MLMIFIISTFLFSNENNEQNKNTHCPKRLIKEPFDLDKGLFFYDDSVFINRVLKDVLNNLDPIFFKSGFISGGFLHEETDRTIKKIPVELFANKNNWKRGFFFNYRIRNS